MCGAPMLAHARHSTGMAAIGSMMVALLRAGDHVVSSQYLFGNTNSLLQTLSAIGVAVSLVDATDADAVEQALHDRGPAHDVVV